MRDDEDEHDQREPEQQRRDHAAHEQMRDRDRAAGGERIDDHVVRGRQQQRLQRAGDGDVDGEQARIAVLDHLRDHHRADRRGIGDGRAGEAAEHGRGDDVDQRHAAANEADEDLGEVDEAFGHAADGHDRAGKDEERDRQQREAAHAAGDLEHHRFERDVDPQRGEDGGEAERIGDRHAQEAQDREAADENENVHKGILGFRRLRKLACGRLYSVAIWLTVSGSGSWKNFCVRRRSITNRTVSAPPIGIGR